MKDRLTLLLAAVFALFLAGCDQPAQQEEPEQQPPTTTAPDEGGPAMTDPVADPTEPDLSTETTSSEMGEQERQQEESETTEPPPR